MFWEKLDSKKRKKSDIMTPFICSWYDQLKLRTFKYGQLFSNPLLLLNNLEKWNNMYWIQKWDKIKNINKHKKYKKGCGNKLENDLKSSRIPNKNGFIIYLFHFKVFLNLFQSVQVVIIIHTSTMTTKYKLKTKLTSSHVLPPGIAHHQWDYTHLFQKR